MKKILLLSILFVAAFNLQAQYTLTDDQGSPIANGATLQVNFADTNQSTKATAHYRLHSQSSDALKFQVLSTSQVTGTQNQFCVGQHCYAPNATISGAEALDANNEALLILYYYPRGHTESATINYKVYNSNNVNIDFEFTVEYTLTSGIELLNASEKLKAYPNPANDKVEIAYKATEASQIVLYNIVGTKVKSFNVSAGTSSIELGTDALPAGTYFYSLINKQGTETKRLVIKH